MRSLVCLFTSILLFGWGAGLPARAGSLHGSSWQVADTYRSDTATWRRWHLEPDELRVTLAPGTGPRFLAVVNLVMGTQTVRSLGHGLYVLRKGPQGDVGDFAAFFKALPYVRQVRPRPRRRPEDQMPQGGVLVGVGSVGSSRSGGSAGANYVEGQMLVKFKQNVTADQIAAFNANHGTTVLGTLKLGNETIYKLAIPTGVAVPDMVHIYSSSGLVDYAEPNYKMSIPERPGTVSGGGRSGNAGQAQGAWGSGAGFVADAGSLAGDSIVVTYRPGVEDVVQALVAMVYGVKDLEDEDDGSVRYSLPKGQSVLTAVRLFKLCPYVLAAEPGH